MRGRGGRGGLPRCPHWRECACSDSAKKPVSRGYPIYSYCDLAGSNSVICVGGLVCAVAGELTPASLQEELAPIAKKWYEFGKKLGASSTLLHSIEQDSRQTAEHYFSRLLSMLADPGSEVKLSWEKIVDVLREIDDGPLAAQLTEKYGISYREREEERERRKERGEGEGEKEGSKHVHVGDTS